MSTPASSSPIPDGPDKLLRIGIMGTPVTSGNRGVQALGAALTRLCLNAAPKVQVLLFGSHPHAGSVVMRPEGNDIDIPIIHWRMSPRSHPRDHLFVITAASFFYRIIPFASFRRWLAVSIPWIGALETAEIVGDVRGGDSFSDIYGLRRFLTATLPVLSVIWVKRDIVLFPQTYGPFKSRTSRWIARWIIRHSSVVIARDLESQKIAQTLAGTDQKIRLSPDVAFALHAEKIALVQLERVTLEPIPANTIGLNINGLMYNGGYTGKNMFGLKLDYRSFVTELATALLATHPGTLLLVPHTYAPAGNVESDNDACRLLKASLPPGLQARVKIVTGDYNAHQLKGIISQCIFFVGSRMHSCIAALSQGVPCVGVAYSMKFRGVFESVGMADWVVDGRSMDNKTAIDSTISLYHQHLAKAEELGRKAKTARETLSEVFASILLSANAPENAASSRVPPSRTPQVN